MSKISIITPIYNADKYLADCIKSILQQKNEEWELLLIDDGSKDTSGLICDEYASKDSRIKVFHKSNGGVSSARNLGLENATGEWLAFIDSDDLVNKEYLSLDDVPVECDVVYKSFDTVRDTMVISSNRILNFKYLNTVSSIHSDYVKNRRNALWNKIIKRKITHDVLFDTNVKVGEDFLFFLNCLNKVKQVCYSPLGCYKYYVRSESAMGRLDKGSHYLYEIVKYNILHVRKLTNNNSLKNVGDAIILITYIPYLNQLWNYVGLGDKIEYKSLIKTISIKSLLLANFKQKILSILPYLYIRFKL